jgi:hypothetical protein
MTSSLFFLLISSRQRPTDQRGDSSSAAVVFSIKSGRAKRSQHTAVTCYRYFSFLGTVFLHREFFGPVFWTRPCAGCIGKKTRTELHRLFFGSIFWTRPSGCINEKQELK